MSSQPDHEQNIRDLDELGFDVSDHLENDGQVTEESWDYDNLTYLS